MTPANGPMEVSGHAKRNGTPKGFKRVGSGRATRKKIGEVGVNRSPRGPFATHEERESIVDGVDALDCVA